MKQLLMVVFLLLILQSLAVSQVVSIYCTWDDLEAARQQRVFGIGVNEMIRQAGFYVVTKEYPNQAAADALLTSDIKLVIGSSHGDATTFYDCNDWSAIWTSAEPKHLGDMQGKIVHFLACQNGKDLAPTMVKEAGAVAVLAYTENFNFSSQSKYNTYCAEGDAEFDRALVQENCTTGEAYEKAKDKFITFANIAISENETEEAETLNHNANCIMLFGDAGAKLKESLTATARTVATVRRGPRIKAKLEKPSDAFLRRIVVGTGVDGVVSMYHYRNIRKAQQNGMKISSPIRHHSQLSNAEFKNLCINRYEALSDSYKLGIRGKNVQMLDKKQMLTEIQNDTEIGQFLMSRYKKFLVSIEETLAE